MLKYVVPNAISIHPIIDQIQSTFQQVNLEI